MLTSIYDNYLRAREEYPQKYARDLAAILGISEAQLTHSRVGKDARRLSSDIRTLIKMLGDVGEIKAITRNEYAVHEHLGCYDNQNLNGHAGLILNPRELDLRLFFSQWHSVFALSEESKRGPRHSIQVFDPHGDAVHKIYTTEKTNMDAWWKLIETQTSVENPELVITPIQVETTSTSVNPAQIDSEWRAMTDVHQFFQLLKTHQVTRQQAFHAVGDDLAFRVANDSLSRLLSLALEDKNEIMIFVANRGCVQIFTGKIERVTPHNEWINIFNPRFTLHLIEQAIAESWITRKPTKDGMVTSLELFAKDGTQIAQLYGQRTEGNPEQTHWREQLKQLDVLQEAVT